MPTSRGCTRIWGSCCKPSAHLESGGPPSGRECIRQPTRPRGYQVASYPMAEQQAPDGVGGEHGAMESTSRRRGRLGALAAVVVTVTAERALLADALASFQPSDAKPLTCS
jgi:hypothetical protein